MTEIALGGHSANVTSVAAPAPASLAVSAPERGQLAFEAVYRDCFELVWRTLRRLGVEPHSLDDAAQEVFLVVHRRLGSFARRSSARTWVVGIAVRVASDFRRRQRRKADPEEPLHPTLLDRRPGPHEALAQAEASRILQQILLELGGAQREVFVLAELEHLTAPEISAALELNVNTVYSRLRAARKAFEEALSRRGGQR